MVVVDKAYWPVPVNSFVSFVHPIMVDGGPIRVKKSKHCW